MIEIAIAGVLALGLTVVGCLLYWLRGSRYRAMFKVAVRRDDSLPCRIQPETFAVSLDGNGFELPSGAPAAAGQTVFLRLRVEATMMGHFFDPFITIGGPPQALRQHLERGARGWRHLNLSHLFQRSDPSGLARVELRSHRLRWGALASLLVFPPPQMSEGDGEAEGELLVLAPHPDDAELGAFGMYATRRSWVVTLTAGERGADLGPVVPPDAWSRWKGRLRVLDSLTNPRLGQVPPERCVNLVYPDLQLEAMFRERPRPVRLACEATLSRASLRDQNSSPQFRRATADATWDDLVAELRLLLETVKPTTILCPHPVLDDHPDHVFTAVALDWALRSLRHPLAASVLLYTVHGASPIHPIGPAETLVSFPPLAAAATGDSAASAGETWVADAVRSHPLAEELRLAKYFAVEAAHDLRSFDTGDPRAAREVFRRVKQELSAYVAGTSIAPTSFLRRAPRPNEIYAVVSQQSLSALVSRALLAREPKP